MNYLSLLKEAAMSHTRPTRAVTLNHLALVAIVVSTSLLLIAWQAGEWGRREALRELRAEANASLLLESAALRSELKRRRSVPMVLARDPDIADLLVQPHDTKRVDYVNRKLGEISNDVDVAAVYVMDREGMTLAASNWNSERSFVGHNFAFRPYFQEALRDGNGEFFALGSVSQRPGYYVAQAVERPIGVRIGVIVMKIQFDELEDRWRQGAAHVFVTDENGVVVLADQPSWQFGTLEKLPMSMSDALRKSLQFGDAQLKPLPFRIRAPKDGIALIDIVDDPRAGHARTYLSVDGQVAGTSWALHTLTPVDARVRRQVLSASLIASLLWLGFSTATLLLIYRQVQVRFRSLEEMRVRKDLERLVGNRTAELTESNERLRNEIEERERVELVLRQAQEKLVHAEKLAALGQMAAGISHEVNQPLSAIRSYADNAIVLHKRGRFAEIESNLSSIVSLTERIGQIMQHLRIFARKASGKVEPVPIKGAIASSLSLMAHRFRREKVRVVQKLPEENIFVWGEQVRIEQVLINLLQNAADAMARSAHPRLCISVESNNALVSLTVADNGTGISLESFPNLFDAFFSTKGDGSLGLGLYISRGIVQEFGGDLSALPHVDGGAVFQVTLRVARDASKEYLPGAVGCVEEVSRAPEPLLISSMPALDQVRFERVASIAARRNAVDQ